MDAVAPWLCLVCGAEVGPDLQGQDLDVCPGCGDEGPPADTGDRLEVALTWHELRILAMWAERWSIAMGGTGGRMARVVAGIADRLEAQHPGRPPLTFTGEMAAMVAQLGHAPAPDDSPAP